MQREHITSRDVVEEYHSTDDLGDLTSSSGCVTAGHVAVSRRGIGAGSSWLDWGAILLV